MSIWGLISRIVKSKKLLSRSFLVDRSAFPLVLHGGLGVLYPQPVTMSAYYPIRPPLSHYKTTMGIAAHL